MVAKGTILKQLDSGIKKHKMTLLYFLILYISYFCIFGTGENIEVFMETFMQGEALLPIPLEDEFIERVKDAVGHVLHWPRHLVIRCSDLVCVLLTA